MKSNLFYFSKRRLASQCFLAATSLAYSISSWASYPGWVPNPQPSGFTEEVTVYGEETDPFIAGGFEFSNPYEQGGFSVYDDIEEEFLNGISDSNLCDLNLTAQQQQGLETTLTECNQTAYSTYKTDLFFQCRIYSFKTNSTIASYSNECSDPIADNLTEQLDSCENTYQLALDFNNRIQEANCP